jgi:hypothetical protein
MGPSNQQWHCPKLDTKEIEAQDRLQVIRQAGRPPSSRD